MQTPIRNGASKSILIADGIRASSLRTPHKTAITESSRSLTYRQLIDRIDRVSNLAHAGWGLRHGDRAALMMRNRLEYMELVCGLSSAGVAVATIGPASAMPEVRFLCEDAGARVLFVDADLKDLAMASIPACVERVIVMGDEYEALLKNASNAILDMGVTENDIFSIPYTSGATGRPKGVMLSHRGRTAPMIGPSPQHPCFTVRVF